MRTLQALALSLSLLPAVTAAQTLSNAHLRAEFGPRGLIALTDLADTRIHRFRRDDFALTLGEQPYESTTLAAPTLRSTRTGVAYRYRAGPFAIDVGYELKPGWRFLSKQIIVTPDSTAPFHVGDITLFRETLEEAPTDVFKPTSARPSLGTLDYGAALRFSDGRSLLLVAQNPFLRFALAHDVATLGYAPAMEWQASYGAFRSDRGLIAPVRLSGRRLPAHMIPEWRVSGDTLPGLDEAEIAAFTGMVRSLFIYEPKAPLNLFVGWCVNDYQIDVGTPEGRAEYRRVFDQAAASGARYVLYAPSNSALSRREESVDDWSWEHVLWLGLGQQIRRDEWDPRSSPVPPSVREMLDYARGKQLGLLAYVYPVLPFTQNPQWLVPSRSDPRKQAASLGKRALQDWLIETLVAFYRRTGIAGYAFDHTFLTFDGTSRYAQWWGWRRVMEELRRRIPEIVIDGRQAYHLYGPWSWLAGSYPHPTFNDEQPESFTPYPDLHFDRVSADRERYTAYRYRNYEFTPSELVPGFITHQTSRSNDRDEMPSQRIPGRGTVLSAYRARDWDYLGWRYSVLSSIAVAGWNNVLNMLPARDSAEHANFAEQDRAWLRRWLSWTATNQEVLRHTRTILGQPALGKLDGTLAIVGGHGFIFLFNPDPRRLSARVPLDASIGLATGERFALRELQPLEGRRLGKPGEGFWRRGDTVTVTLEGGSAQVLEVSLAPVRVQEPVLFGAPGTAMVSDGVLALRDVTGPMGTTAHLLVVLPPRTMVQRATVNGVPTVIVPRGTAAVDLTIRFAGAEFHQLQPAAAWDSSFSGGHVTGSFTIPQRVFDQLRARRRAWPIPWTPEDYRTTWLVPERLLLYASFSEPDDRWEARLSIDGKPVELRKAYTAVRVVPSTFVGFYADVSSLDADRPYRFELELPALKRGQFLGLYFENVEPEYGTAVVPPGP
ncbi:MAG TPA: hypothetical protein VGQ69_06535 [Gemmatimonadales bacterium]|nr:hypothetical protein [Gemmatimonadales bacterium]